MSDTVRTVRIVETRVSVVHGTCSVALPGCREVLRVACSGVGSNIATMLLAVSEIDFAQFDPGISGVPQYYMHDRAGGVRVWPTPSVPHTLNVTYVPGAPLFDPAWLAAYHAELAAQREMLG